VSRKRASVHENEESALAVYAFSEESRVMEDLSRNT